MATACWYRESERNTGSHKQEIGNAPQSTVIPQGIDPACCDAERVIVPMKSGNADGGKDPWSWRSVCDRASDEGD